MVAMSGWRMLNEPDATEQRRSETPSPRSIDVPPSRLAFYPLTMPLTTGPGTISVAISLGAGRPRGFHPLLLEFFVETLAAVGCLRSWCTPSIEIRPASPASWARPAPPSWCACRPFFCFASASKCYGMAPRNSWAPCGSGPLASANCAALRWPRIDPASWCRAKMQWRCHSNVTVGHDLAINSVDRTSVVWHETSSSPPKPLSRRRVIAKRSGPPGLIFFVRDGAPRSTNRHGRRGNHTRADTPMPEEHPGDFAGRRQLTG